MNASPFKLKSTRPGAAARLQKLQSVRARARQLKTPNKKKFRREITLARKKQAEGFESAEIFKLTIEAKLNELRPTVADRLAESDKPIRWFDNFTRCGRELIYKICIGCERVEELPYNCNLKWCPRCNWRIAERRRRLLEKMTHGMTGCKHVVLTQRNTAQISRAQIQANSAALAKLRRLEVFGVVSGGCSSTEFTNEGRGWHMHNHLLVQSDFIDAKKLSLEWGRLVGQDYAIVKILALKDRSYLQEICKYAVEGSEIARWSGEDIYSFISALRNTRLFRTFGKFNELRKFAAATIKNERPEKEPCPCGCPDCLIAPTKDMAHALWRREWGIR